MSLQKALGDIAACARPARILIIDDDAASNTLMESYLFDYHCEVTTATNAAEGLALALNTSWNVIFLDLKMGSDQMSGQELFGRIRKEKEHQRVVIFSGYVLPDAVDELRDVGCCFILPKPGTFNRDFFTDVMAMIGVDKK